MALIAFVGVASAFSTAPSFGLAPPLRAVAQGRTTVVADVESVEASSLVHNGRARPDAANADDAAPPTRFVFGFGAEKMGDEATQRALLGGKGANLAEMARIGRARSELVLRVRRNDVDAGLPVPPGFTISTDVCTYFYANGREYPPSLNDEVRESMKHVELVVGKTFGDADDPLLVSVRSGARKSMPGMMDTILNLGLNDATVQGLANKTGNERFALDCYRRFIAMYGDVVMGVQPRHENDHPPFDALMEELKRERNKRDDVELTSEDLRDLVARFKALVLERTGRNFPQDPYEQLCVRSKAPSESESATAGGTQSAPSSGLGKTNVPSCTAPSTTFRRAGAQP